MALWMKTPQERVIINLNNQASPSPDTISKMVVPPDGKIGTETIKARLTYLDLEEKKYRILVEGSVNVLKEIEKENEFLGLTNVGWTYVSIGTGVAIAALTAASVTGNAVWIAGLGAFAAGVGVLQGAFATEVINRGTLQKYKEALTRQITEAMDKVNFYELRPEAPTANNQQWFSLLKGLGRARQDLEQAVLLTTKDVEITVTTGKNKEKDKEKKAAPAQP